MKLSVLLASVVACVLLLSCSGAVSRVAADTPANCSYSDFLGDWTLTIGGAATPGLTSLDCSTFTPVDSLSVTLSYPNVARANTEPKSVGNWTLIYNQGSEIWLGGNIYFAFSAYTSTASLCDRSSNGWMHDELGNNWACFSMQRDAQRDRKGRVIKPRLAATEPSIEVQAERLFSAERAADPVRLHTRYKTDHAYLAAVNKAAGGQFTVKDYGHEAAGRTIGEMERRRGRVTQPGAASVLQQLHASDSTHLRHPQKHASEIPSHFDWRNISGQNFVSPVRNQGSCGSCYAFGSAAMMEARIRIATNNKKQPVLSTQDIVSCSNYAQGCEGGFPYLIAGKYGRDFGLVEEDCYPYVGVDEACQPNPLPGCNSTRWFTNQYYYIGGYYGASTIQLMQEELMANGPIAVSFFVYDDFESYSGGVYSHQFAAAAGLQSFNPFEITNHVVSIVGWGVTDDAAATPYWIVKNSWGTSWGEDGFFRILRGSSEPGGECAIESITVSAIPIND